jgi:hypothetical protein
MTETFEEHYPNIASWIYEHQGWIEIGRDEYSSSFIRILDMGGMIWEGKEQYTSIDDALAAADQAIIENKP